jgi:hypothetical protein
VLRTLHSVPIPLPASVRRTVFAKQMQPTKQTHTHTTGRVVGGLTGDRGRGSFRPQCLFPCVHGQLAPTPRPTPTFPVPSPSPRVDPPHLQPHPTLNPLRPSHPAPHHPAPVRVSFPFLSRHADHRERPLGGHRGRDGRGCIGRYSARWGLGVGGFVFVLCCGGSKPPTCICFVLWGFKTTNLCLFCVVGVQNHQLVLVLCCRRLKLKLINSN